MSFLVLENLRQKSLKVPKKSLNFISWLEWEPCTCVIPVSCAAGDSE